MASDDSSPEGAQPLSQNKADIINPHLQEPTIPEIQAAAREALKLDHDIACHRFSEGTDHAVYAIGDGYVARCLPVSEKAIKGLKRDAAVQNLAKKYMRNPEIIAEVLETPLESGQWRGNIERRLPGVSLEKAEPTERTEEDLARLLMDLRAVPVGEALAATQYQESKINIKSRVTKTLRAWEDMIQAGHAVDPEEKLPQLLRERLQQVLASTEDEESYTPTFLHADINTENVLIDPSTGAVTGVIDWSDAFVGDLCVDMSGVIFAIGVTRAKRVANMAGLSEREFERALLYTMTEMIRDLRNCLCGEGDEWGRSQGHLEEVLRGEWPRVFGGTECEGLLVSKGVEDKVEQK